MPTFAATIFLSAFLLFLVQPLVAKQILPWFGGSAAVWNTCMVFFQAMLLAGYAYSDGLSRWLSTRGQALLHGTLLVLSLAWLPVTPEAGWKPAGGEDPALRILGLLFATIGLPYFLLSSTSPLIQTWIARRFSGVEVYRLFALSNFGSLLALLVYPFLIEPAVAGHAQALGWSAAYVLYAGCCAVAAHASARSAASAGPAQAARAQSPPSLEAHVVWIALPALGSLLLLAITNHITQNIASIPLLWLAPLTLYLVTFILCFERGRWYRRGPFAALFALALGAMAWALQANDAVLHIKFAVPLYCAGLFIACMVLHGELARAKPAPRHLTRFYLLLALGGALGGAFVSLAAPRLFPAYFELPLGLAASGLAAAWCWRRERKWIPAAALAAAAAAAYFALEYFRYVERDAILVARNFYGALRVQQSGTRGDEDEVRRLMHGVIMHGKQYLDPARKHLATTYYGETSGIGRTLASLEGRPRRVGVIGLGTGTIAVYGRPGDVFRFYDINPLVIDIAKTQFTYLRDSRARIETILGDARLMLEREPPQGYDVLAVDAFSSDAIPVHLITREALAVYLRHLKPEGVIAFHVTNRYLELAPVVRRLAEPFGLHAILVSDEGAAEEGAASDWVLLSRSRAPLEAPLLAGAAEEIESPPGEAPWTDDYNNLLRALK